ncbi:MAG TPA: hypothetical protein VGQ83_35560 [Polyangia bacterium]
MKRVLPGLVAAALALWAGSARGDIPRLINFQGRLATTSDTALTGAYSITFRIYPNAIPTTGEVACHSAPQAVAANNGLFHVLIGAPSGLSPCAFGAPQYLELQVAGDQPMTPRIPLSAAAYAITAMALVEPGTSNYRPVGNAPGGIPVSNGTINAGLNGQYLEGHPWSDVTAVTLTRPLYRVNAGCLGGKEEAFSPSATCTVSATPCPTGCTGAGTCTCTNCLYGYLR